MGIEERYDPEDIEQLMIEKPFDQLLEDERLFVLKHVSDKDEYERIRSTMFVLKEHIDDEDTVAPRPDMRRELIAAFKKEKKRNYRYWLNSVGAFFLPQDGRAIWVPLFRIASILILLGGLWIGFDTWQHMAQEQQFAELAEPESKIERSDVDAKNENFKIVDGQSDDDNNGSSTNTPSVIEDLEQTAVVQSDAAQEILEDEMEEPIFDVPGNKRLADPSTTYEVEEAPEATMDAIPRQEMTDIEERKEYFSQEDESMVKDVQVASAMEKSTIQNLSVETITATRADVARMNKAIRTSRTSRNLAQDANLIGLLTQAF